MKKLFCLGLVMIFAILCLTSCFDLEFSFGEVDTAFAQIDRETNTLLENTDVTDFVTEEYSELFNPNATDTPKDEETDVEEVCEHIDTNLDGFCDLCEYDFSVAKVVNEHEKERKELIEFVKKEKPGYNVYSCLSNRVSCSLYVQDRALIEDVIEEYDLRALFPQAEFGFYEYVDFFIMRFGREDFTELVYSQLEQISQKPLITKFYFNCDYDFYIRYMPDINYFAKNPIALNDYEVAQPRYSGKEKESLIIKSKEENDTYLDSLNYSEDYVNEQKAQYDEAFFEENALIITKAIELPSSSIDLTLKNLYISGDTVYVVFETDIPNVTLSDGKILTYIITVPQRDVAGVDKAVTLQ
jgi:hypothetical protein